MPKRLFAMLLGAMTDPGNRSACAIACFACLTTTTHALAQWTSIDLHPDSATESHALGVGDGQQVGYAVVGNRKVASLWEGTAATWVSLDPAGASESVAYRTRGGVQVGYAVIGG